MLKIDLKEWVKHSKKHNHFKPNKEKSFFFRKNIESIIKNCLKSERYSIYKQSDGKIVYILNTNINIWFDTKKGKKTKAIKMVLNKDNKTLITIYPWHI